MILEYGIKKGYKSTAELTDEEVDNLLKEDDVNEQVKLDI
jgi:hypothetical protein